MITPSVLILASSSLSMTTSQRLSRSIDRVREVSEKLKQLNSGEITETHFTDLKQFLVQALVLAARRSHYLQQTMTSLYFAICIFVTIIIAIGVMEVMGLKHAWILLSLGFCGVILLLIACIMLLLETRLAVVSVKKEMAYILSHHLER